MKVLDGASLAAQIKEDLKTRVKVLKEAGVVPGLATLLVGDDKPSARYVDMKHADCAEVGIASSRVDLSADAQMSEILEAVAGFNASDSVHAYLIQYPFPKGLDYFEALQEVDPQKDADGLHPINLGRLVAGVEGPMPCTPAGIMKMLAHYDIQTEGADVVVLGRGLTIGRPLALMLSQKKSGANAAVTCVHTGVKDIAAHTARADILVAAAGSPGIIQKDMVKPGAAVIAAGVTYEGKKLLSDVADDVADVAGALSPKVGGVGPMTRAMLLENTVLAAEAVLAQKG